MTKALLGVCVGLILFTGAGCGAAPPPAEPAGPSAEDITAIRAMTDRFREALLAKDWPALESLYADRAVLMPPEAATVMGARPIADWFAGSGLTVKTLDTTVDAIGGSGNLAVNRGTYTLVAVPSGATGDVTERGRYLWVVQRQTNGTWRITADIWNTDAPATR